MAQKVQTFLIDDLDGSEAEGTVLFGLDGVHYEIDLSTEHAKDLRTALARYADAGRKVTGTARRAAQNGRKAPAASISSTEVRTWAKAQGLELKERGRIPQASSPSTRPLRAASSTAIPGPVRHPPLTGRAVSSVLMRRTAKVIGWKQQQGAPPCYRMRGAFRSLTTSSRQP